MSVPDYDQKYRIYRYATDFCNISEFQYHFVNDAGDRETAIIFNRETGECKKPTILTLIEDLGPDEMYEVPDICDYRHKIVFEYEEETGPRKPGAHMARKGHGHDGDEYTKNDAEKYENYEAAGIRYCRIWEEELHNGNVWKVKIAKFLIRCWQEDNTPENLKKLADLEDDN
jgi:hypothetical protein